MSQCEQSLHILTIDWKSLIMVRGAGDLIGCVRVETCAGHVMAGAGAGYRGNVATAETLARGLLEFSSHC